MNIHSVPTASVPRRRPDPPAAAGKRDAILRAAIDVFAERGFFNAQVADVARAAGVAAGTVYLYFRSKDDLLVSIFERTVREAPRTRGAPPSPTSPIRPNACAASHGCTSACWDATATSRSCSRWSSGSRSSSWSASRRRCCATTSDRSAQAIADGQRTGAFRADVSATAVAKMFFGALDEMATNWILSRRRYNLESDADRVVDLFLDGARAR